MASGGRPAGRAAGAALGWIHDEGRAAVKNQMASEKARDRNSQGRDVRRGLSDAWRCGGGLTRRGDGGTSTLGVALGRVC